MEKLGVRIKEQLEKLEEIARKIEITTGQDLKIEEVKKESRETTLARIEKTAREIEKLVGHKIDVEKLQEEASDRTLARLEEVAERIKEWKEVP